MTFEATKKTILYTIGLPFLLPIWIIYVIFSPFIFFIVLLTSNSWGVFKYDFFGFYKFIFTGNL